MNLEPPVKRRTPLVLLSLLAAVALLSPRLVRTQSRADASLREHVQGRLVAAGEVLVRFRTDAAATLAQARRDVGSGAGMTVVVGRVRTDPQLDLRLVALGHNTIRGAAGGSVLNAELLVATGVVGSA